MHGGKEGEASFCITRGDATPSLEVKKGVLDQVPYTVQFSVVIALLEVDPFFRQFGGKFKVGLCHS